MTDNFRYYVLKIKEKQNVSINYLNNIAFVKIHNISDYSEYHSEEDKFDKEKYQVLTKDVFLNNISSYKINSMCNIDEYYNSEIEENLKTTVQKDIKYSYVSNYFIMHPYYIESLIKNLISNDNLYENKKSFIFSKEFTRLFLKLRFLFNNDNDNLNICTDMSNYLNNYECSILYDTLYYYCRSYYTDIKENLYYLAHNLDKKQEYLSSKYQEFQEKINENKQEVINDFSMLSNKTFLICSRYPIIIKTIKSPINNPEHKIINYSTSDLFESSHISNIFHTDYNLFEEPDIKIQYQFIKMIYYILNFKYQGKNQKNIHYFNNKSIIINQTNRYVKSKELFIINNIFNTKFYKNNSIFVKFKMLPVKISNQNLETVKILLGQTIFIKKDIYNQIFNSRKSINMLWLLFMNNILKQASYNNYNYNNLNLIINREVTKLIKSNKNSEFEEFNLFNKEYKSKIENFIWLPQISFIIDQNDKINNKQDLKLENPVNIEKFNNSKTILNKLLNVAPFEYQLKNMFWMNQIEESVLEKNLKFEYYYNIDFFRFYCTKTGKTFICRNKNFEQQYYDLNTQEFNIQKINTYFNKYYYLIENTNITIKEESQFNFKKYIKNLEFNGGLINDEVGLGKTLSAICLILNNLERDLEGKYKKASQTKYFGNNLIIVPNRLVTQWYMEFKKYLKPKLFELIGIKQVLSLNDIKKDLYDIKFKKYNIYIISNNLVSNKNYVEYLKNDYYDIKAFQKYVKTNKISYDIEIPTNIKDVNKLLILNNDKLNQDLKKFKLDPKKKFNIFRKWNRIFVDECHEVLKENLEGHPYCSILTSQVECRKFNIKRYTSGTIPKFSISKVEVEKCNLFYKLNSNFKWLISATPFEKSIANFYAYINFLNNKFCRSNKIFEEKLKPYDYQLQKLKNTIYGLPLNQIKLMFENIMRRTTKKDIKNVVDIPIFTEEITFLNQNSVERNIYLEALRSNDIKRLLKLCTHIMVSNETLIKGIDTNKILSIDDIKNIMVLKYKKESKILLNENETLEFENNQGVKLTEKLSELKLKFDIYDFETPDSQYYINENFIYQTKMYLSRRYYSYNRYNKNHQSLNREELSKIYLDPLLIDNLLDNFGLLEENINTIIESGDFFKALKHKLFVVKNLYLSELTKFEYKWKSNLDKIAKNKYEISRLLNQIKIFENDTFVKEAVKDPCSICFTDFEDKLCITSCRHIVCDKCIQILMKNKPSIPCPFCRTTITSKDINFTSIDKINDNKNDDDNNDDNNNEEVDTDQEKIKKYGTKLAYLLDYLGEIFKNQNNRVIIFSQYDEMLKLVGNVLNDFKIKNIFVKGNIMSITKKINLFKTDPSYRVIMLSSDRSSSGSNLTEASHIIFADVINGDKQMTKSIESQAIGRAVRIGQKKPVVVKRILMKNTIEEEIYIKNKYDMTDLQL